MRQFGVIVKLGGRSKAVKKSIGQITYASGPSYGLTEYYGPVNGDISTGCKVWIYSRQTPREIADTFFHEMAHVFLHMFGGVKKQGKREEDACRWIGYLSKLMLAEYDRKKYGRRVEEK